MSKSQTKRCTRLRRQAACSGFTVPLAAAAAEHGHSIAKPPAKRKILSEWGDKVGFMPH
jgi:hypothetical protein